MTPRSSLSKALLEEIQEELEKLTYGSLEIYVQNSTVTQITVRSIKKTSSTINSPKSTRDNSIPSVA